MSDGARWPKADRYSKGRRPPLPTMAMAAIDPEIEIPSWTATADGCCLSFAFTVQGKPIAMMRCAAATVPRKKGDSGRKVVVYNKQRAQLQLFRDKMQAAIPFSRASTPYFPTTTMVSLILTFRVRRPNSHYHGSVRQDGRLRPNFQNCCVTGGDIDNMIKFVLDAMNGVAYHDDKQVCSLVVKKIWTDDCNSEGSTTVQASTL